MESSSIEEKKRMTNRASKTESEISKYLIGDFDPNKSLAKPLLEKMLNCSINDIKLCYLLRLAHLFRFYTGVKITRNYSRNKILIIKWFEENIAEIANYSKYIKIEFEK